MWLLFYYLDRGENDSTILAKTRKRFCYLTKPRIRFYYYVCHNSGHAEAVHIQYDETILPLTKLLQYYFAVIDPVSANRQGNDIGVQYRTGIYYSEESQLSEIESVYAEEEKKSGESLAVEIKPLKNFFSAEDYHQKYLDKNPSGYCHIPARHLSGFVLQDCEESR